MAICRPVRLLGTAAAVVAAAATGMGGGAHAGPLAAVHPFHVDVQASTKPTPTSTCVAVRAIHCYSPAQFEAAYNLGALHSKGIDGSGMTIAIVDSFGSPTIRNDLHVFDQIFGVSNPYGIPIDPAIAVDPQLDIIAPAGPIPPFNPANGDHVGWAQETTLDVEWAHVFAPKAKLLLVETPVAETEGVTGFPEIVAAENYVIDHNLADVITQSFGATEETFPTKQSLLDLRSAYKNAKAHHVTVLASSGDTGATNFVLDGSALYNHPVNSWPSSDPLVTSLGGTQLTLDDQGKRTAPDVVWNDSYGAGGGGPSHVFTRPGYQEDVRDVTGPMRGTPDISLSSAVDGGVWVYYTFVNAASPYHIFGGTSEASPEFSGIVAMAAQVAGHRLGLINKALYDMNYREDGLVDVTSGNNSFAGVTGFSAGPGYDLASGVGTINAAKFVLRLADSAGDGGGGGDG